MAVKALQVAALQMVSCDKLEVNLETVALMVSKAAKQGVKLIVLPENFALMAARSSDFIALAETLGSGPVQDKLAELAQSHNIWIIAGSFPIQSPQPSKVYACCLVYNNAGEQVAHYNKIHLFDVDIPNKKQRYQESKTFSAGSEPVVVESPLGKIGLSICYDLRFPELYRKLLDAGAQIIVAPSAFTYDTGQAHWELLCRTRALENLCYLIAPNQGGQHSNGRQTYGHSMIVSPWGEVLGEVTEAGAALVIATIDKTKISDVRQSFPALLHRRVSS